MIRIFIVTDSTAGLASLEALFHGDPRFEVVGQGRTSRGCHPDVILMDLAVGRVAWSRFEESAPVVLLGDDLSRAEVHTALHNGVRAILSRGSSAREIAAAVEAVVAGLTALDQEHTEALLPSSIGRAHARDAAVAEERLTPRELEVLALLSQGVGNKAIARRLGVSEHTVKFHVSSILGKLGAVSRTEAVKEAIMRGLVLL